MNKVINIRDQGHWNFLVSLRKYLNIALEYDIPMEKERKEYKEYLRDLAA